SFPQSVPAPLTSPPRPVSACCQRDCRRIGPMNTHRLIRRIAIPCSLAAALLVAGALALSPRAQAGDHDDHVEARLLLQRGEILPLSRILAIVQQRVPGDVVEVELEHGKHHGWEYEVKVLTAQGRVREVKLNARSGEVRKVED